MLIEMHLSNTEPSSEPRCPIRVCRSGFFGRPFPLSKEPIGTRQIRPPRCRSLGNRRQVRPNAQVYMSERAPSLLQRFANGLSTVLRAVLKRVRAALALTFVQGTKPTSLKVVFGRKLSALAVAAIAASAIAPPALNGLRAAASSVRSVLTEAISN
jgi:hypothetical protein